jgi:lysophospholipase L1-like esterase
MKTNEAPRPSTAPRPEPEVRAGRGVGLGVLIACLLLVAAELALQVRAEIRVGQSVFSSSQDEAKYTRNEELGVRTLRPSAVIGGAQQTIRTNRYGLRGDDFELAAPADEIRLAQLGASTIQGAFARTNEETSSAALERRLNVLDGGRNFRVINAGLDGATLNGQGRLLERLLTSMSIRQVIWYPGTNDIGCAPRQPSTGSPPVRIPWPGVPRWTLSNDLIVLNTAWIRKSRAPSNQNLVRSFDLDEMRAAIERGIAVAQSNGISLVLVTSANSYRWTMDDAEITRRASTALFFRPCYTGPDLAAAVQAFNQMLRDTAARHEIPLIDAEQQMPADLAFYGDSNHFSPAGEDRYAQLIAEELARRNLLVGRVAQ